MLSYDSKMKPREFTRADPVAHLVAWDMERNFMMTGSSFLQSSYERYGSL